MKKAITIYFINSFLEEPRKLSPIVIDAINELEATTNYRIKLISNYNIDQLSIQDTTLKYIQESDIVIFNVYYVNANTMYEIGVAHAFGKITVLLVNSEIQLPFDLARLKYLVYNPKQVGQLFKEEIVYSIKDAIEKPEFWNFASHQKELKPSSKTVFVSYSHKDILYLDRLKVHLRPLERKSLIQLWSDTLIQSGEKWKIEIQKALDKAAIALLLISADFLASEFIINNELQPLLKDAEKKGTIIIPIILKPCRFLREPSLSQFQAVNDPHNPICKMEE